MHADAESLLLLALGVDLPPALHDWVEEHLSACAPCSDRLHSLLESSLRDEATPALEPLRAAGATTRKWPAPAPLAPVGKLSGAALYRLPGETLRFGVDRLEWASRTLRIRIPGQPPIVGFVDEFRRLSVGEDAARLAAALAGNAELEVESLSVDPLDQAAHELEPALERFFRRSAREAAPDLLQETRLRLEKLRAAYDPARPAAPWIWRIAWLVLLEHRRARRKAPVELAAEPPARLDLEPARRETRQLVWTCARDLEDGRARTRTFVVLHALEGVSHVRLFRRFGVRESASKMRVLRGLEELERRLLHERFLWPEAKTAAASEAWDLVLGLEPTSQHAALLAVFGRVGLDVQRELGLGGEPAGLDEVALARAHESLVAAGFPEE